MTKTEFRNEIVEFLEKKHITFRKRIFERAWIYYEKNQYLSAIQAYDRQVRVDSKGKQCVLPD